MDWVFRDREAVADVLVRYYTDYEAGSLWIAESEGQVVGYLTGCLDTRRHDRMVRRVVSRAVAAAMARGALWRLETWRLATALAATALCGGFPPVIDKDLYPAHFHINVKHDFRGRRLGSQLVESFKRQADHAGVGGIHVVARGDNAAGRSFFETMGFRLVREQPLILPRGPWLRKTSTVVYAWTREA